MDTFLKKKKHKHVPTISEYHEMRDIADVDDVCHKRYLPPSPRRHSVSSDFCDNKMSPNPEWASSEKSKLTANLRSLPRMNRPFALLNMQLLEAVESENLQEIERLLEAGASPDATCNTDLVSACHIAALTGGDALSLLLKRGAKKYRADGMGRTPIHFAAWAGHIYHIGLLIDLPESIKTHDDVTAEVIEEICELTPQLRETVNKRCKLSEATNVPSDCYAVFNYRSEVAERLPSFAGWTPLHAASSGAHQHCVRLLLDSGADPSLRDANDCTPLDVAGSAYYSHPLRSKATLPADSTNFVEVVRMLLGSSDFPVVPKQRWYSPLHAAVELQIVEGVTLLLAAGAFKAELNCIGETPLHVAVRKRLKEHMQVLLFSEFENSLPTSAQLVNMRDKKGYTVLHSSVLSNWQPGVCLALKAGAETNSRSNDGETPIHTAADLGFLEILKEILIYSKRDNIINVLNENGETALFKAVSKGHTECTKTLLEQGACINITPPHNINVIHKAAELGHYDMLKLLLDDNPKRTQCIINNLTDQRGYAPIHIAVEKGQTDCVELLISRKAYINQKARSKKGPNKGVTPLHIAATKNYKEIAELILMHNISSMYMQDDLGLNALHTACFNSSRDVIKLLLRQGSDISAYSGGDIEQRITPVELIMNNLSKPTEFIAEIFDSYIECNDKCPQDPDSEITIDFRILAPNTHMNSDLTSINDMDMKVIEALLKSGNAHNQRRLLIHPLVESFLCLKWEALLPFFYATMALYGLFMITLAIFVLSVYCNEQLRNGTESVGSTIASQNETVGNIDRRYLVYESYTVYLTICLVVLQEFMYMKISRRYFFQLETGVKLSSIVLAMILPKVIFGATGDWPRHLAMVALLMSCSQMTFLLSRVLRMGFYVLIFWKVAKTVLKILLIFLILLIGFALSFMIEYRSRVPFENPWGAFVKTVAMMTSEFDYNDLVDEKNYMDTQFSLHIIRLLFLIFVILSGIVLMNLMVAVAVNDLNDLEVSGSIMRMEKKVQFLASMNALANYKLFMKLLTNNMKCRIKSARRLSQTTFRPSSEKFLSNLKAIAHLKDAIIDKAHSQKKKADDQLSQEKLYKKMELIVDFIINSHNLETPKSISTPT